MILESPWDALLRLVCSQILPTENLRLIMPEEAVLEVRFVPLHIATLLASDWATRIPLTARFSSGRHIITSGCQTGFSTFLRFFLLRCRLVYD